MKERKTLDYYDSDGTGGEFNSKTDIMMRKRDEPEPAEDPSQPLAGYSPFETLPLDVLYKLFVSSGFSIQQLKRLCSTDRRIREACRNEYIWRKLYFLKVVKDATLATLSERDGADRAYVDNVLMQTPEGRVWTEAVDLGLADSPYMLLIALSWRQFHLETRKETFWSHPDGARHQIWIKRSSNQALYVYNLTGNYDVLEALGLKPRPRLGGADLVDFVQAPDTLAFICRLIRAGYVPRIASSSRSSVAPALTETCISCNAANPTRLCGNRCGMVAYCNQQCAEVHWVKRHAAECKPVGVQAKQATPNRFEWFKADWRRAAPFWNNPQDEWRIDQLAQNYWVGDFSDTSLEEIKDLFETDFGWILTNAQAMQIARYANGM